MGTTPIYGFPYPDPSDLVANYPALGQQLAEDIEDALPTLGGMTLVTAQSFTAAATISLNNCFTSTYSNYRLMLRAFGSTSVSLSMRLRAAGTDDTGSNYLFGRYIIGAGVPQAALSQANQTGTSFPILVMDTTVISGASIDLFDPQKASRASGTVLTGGYFLDIYGLSHSQSTAYDGFTINTNTGTTTGTVRVYGYKD